MFENITKFLKKFNKKEGKVATNSRDAAKERLHLVLMQDRANVSADFLELMKQEIIEVIKKYIDVDEAAIDVRLTNKENEDGTNGAPALYANIPILQIKNETKKVDIDKEKEEVTENKKEIEETIKQENNQEDEKESQEEETAEVIIDDGQANNDNEKQKEETTNIEEKQENEDTKEELKSEN